MLLHTALKSQLCVPLVHSSISETKKEFTKKRFIERVWSRELLLFALEIITATVVWILDFDSGQVISLLFFLVFVSIEKVIQTFWTMFHHLSKHLTTIHGSKKI